MTSFQRHALVVLLVVLAGGLAISGADAQNDRLPMLTNERGGPPIARWRVHAKGLERLPEARKIDFITKYTRAAQLQPEEIVVLTMVLRRVDLASAARLVGMQARVAGLEEMLRREQRAGEVRLAGKRPATRLVPIWPPPGYYHKSAVKKKKAE